MSKWKPFGILPGLGASLLPAGLCPVCWTAYTGVLSAVGCSFLLQTVYLLPLISLLLCISLASLAYKAESSQPFSLGLIAAVSILVGKFVFESNGMMFGGIAVLIIVSIWNSWPRKTCRI